MNNPKPFHRRIAIILLAIFLPSLLPVNLLYASNNGPVAPEAVSFEPIDATDMVNLISGDMSYVLPILNVPSPEGGYPLALSYHAGIAMDQEASWTGLGWNINPGAINRSVSGVPDDWDKTNVMELLYDQGETLHQYDFSIGGTLPNGVTLGMSKSWGQHKAWGGIVGFGGVNMSFGSENFGMSASTGFFNISMDDLNGTSVGLSFKQGVFKSAINYNLTNKKFSGSAEYGMASTSISDQGLSLGFGALGVSLSTKGGVGYSVAGYSTRSLNTSATSGDFYTNTSTNGYNINAAGFFWVSYQHTRFTYSLFLLNRNDISGTLNLFDTKKENGYIQDNKSYMDVKQYSYGYNITETSNLLPRMTDIDVVYPNYDNYSVASQGLSGAFSPKIFEEVNLYGKGSNRKVTDSGTPNFTDSDFLFLTQPASSYDGSFELNNKIHFYFDNVNSSFLRIKKGDFISLSNSFTITNDLGNPFSGNPTKSTIGSEGTIVNNVVTQTDNAYSSSLTVDGNLKRLGTKKRDGNHIEAFTNRDILQNNTNGYFIEGNNYDRNFYYDLAKEGIGAYRITALDGKVYHYSIPVYNFEEMNKNYSNSQNENDKFIEFIKNKPYATHWLLTAITGPDYVDINNNKVPDENDYGYWVTFDYSKWTDGYGWRSPKIGAKEMDGKFSYFWGRKEIYYLDKVKTRTHSAVFIKSLRNDDKSSKIEYGVRNQQGQLAQYTPGSTSLPMNRHITELFRDRNETLVEQGSYYGDSSWGSINYSTELRHFSSKYVNLPVNTTLKLEKILLLRNDDASQMIRQVSPSSSPSLINQTDGYTYFDYGFNDSFTFFRKNPFNVKKATIHTSNNLYDIDDVAHMKQNLGIDIESKALKVINFNYDYSLGNNLPNALSGRLTLKSIEMNGRGNTKTLPPYKFNYTKSATPYDFSNSDDWGYVKDNPDAWSLNEIITPTGGKLNFEYESDSFIFEAIREGNARKKFEIPFAAQNSPGAPVLNYEINGDIFKLNLNPNNSDINSYNLNDLFIINDVVKMKYVSKEYNPSTPYFASMINSFIDYEIVSVNNTLKTVELKILDSNDLIVQNDYFSNNNCQLCDNVNAYTRWCGTYPPSNNLSCKYAIYFDMIAPQNLIDYGANGKKGGGIRVKKITLKDEMNNSFETHYSYLDPKTNNISGITSYEPTDNNLFGNDKYFGVEELPSPEVMYKYVSVSNINNNNLISKSVYEFSVLERLQRDVDNNRLNNFEIPEIYSFNREKYQSQNNYFQKIDIYDKQSSLGRIEEIKHYNSLNQLLNSTKYNYNEFDPNSLENGTIQESFKYYKRGNRFNPKYNGATYIGPVQNPIYAMYRISKTTLPNILKSVTNSQSGYTETIFYDKYDFLTGQTLETRGVKSDGKTFKTKIVPAYQKYSSMGSKVDNSNNANMLSQVAASYSYIQDNGVWKETGVGITTWNNEWVYQDLNANPTSPTNPKEKIWRKHKTYTWSGVTDSNGIFENYNSLNDTDDGFIWTVGVGTVQSSQWKQTSEVTLYDHYSMPLEVKDINGNKAATKMDVFNEKVQATGNAGYNEMYYSGAEESIHDFYVGQEVRLTNANTSITSNYAHTGKNCVAATDATQFGVLMYAGHRPGKYKISVWAHKDNYQKARLRWFNNDADNTFEFNGEKYFAGDWVLLNHYVDAHYMDLNNTAAHWYVNSIDNTTVYFDDLMIRPIASSITGYVYNEYDELTHIIGNNGLATRFEYDAAGRLIKTYVEILDDASNGVTGGFKLSTKNKINYRHMN